MTSKPVMSNTNSNQNSNQIGSQGFEVAYQKLNSKQKQAVDTVYGPVMVVAIPGSGKTQLLSLRVANILQKTDTDPGSILCLTFTDLAADNMEKRLKSIVGPQAEKVNFFTFHSFAKSLIDQYGEYFFGGFESKAINELQQVRFLHQILHDLHPDDPLFSAEQSQKHGHLSSVKKKIQNLKNAGINPYEFEQILSQNQVFFEKTAPLIADFFELDMNPKILPKLAEFVQNVQLCAGDSYFVQNSKNFQSYGIRFLESLNLATAQIQALGGKKTKPLTRFRNHFCIRDATGKYCLKDRIYLSKNLALARVYASYQDLLSKEKLYDFEDMILEAVQKIRQNLDLKLTLQERFQFIMVDEFQDTNGAQMSLINELVDVDLPNFKPNLMVVGDDDQAIYKFQGANLDNILGFQERFGDGLKVVILDKNYRSKQDILDLAAVVIEQVQDRLTSRIGIQKPLVSAI